MQAEPERIPVASRSFLAACALEGRERLVTAGGGTDVEKPGFSLTALPAAIRKDRQKRHQLHRRNSDRSSSWDEVQGSDIADRLRPNVTWAD